MASVTQVLGHWADFSKIPPEVLNNAARRGTLAHSYFAAYAKKLFIPTPPEEIAGFFHSFKRWFDQYVDRIFFIEQAFVDPVYRYHGHADAGVRMTDGRHLVADWKTPATASKTWPLQTAAYLHLAKTINIKWDGCMILQPRVDGGPARATVYPYTDHHFSVFLSALNCHYYFKGE